MKTAGATMHSNMMHTDATGHSKPSIFTNMEPQGAITKPYFNIQSRIKMDGIRTAAGSFLPNKKDFEDQKNELDDVYQKYENLYHVEKVKQKVEKAKETYEVEMKDQRAKEHRRLAYNHNQNELRQQMQEKEMIKEEEEVIKLAKEQITNQHIRENKTIASVFPEMHAVPQYLQKEWDRQKQLDLGKQYTAAVEKKQHSLVVAAQIEKERYNKAVEEQQRQELEKEQKMVEAQEKRTFETLKQWDIQKRTKDIQKKIKQQTKTLENSILLQDRSKEDFTQRQEVVANPKHSFEIKEPQKNEHNSRSFYRSVDPKSAKASSSYNILWASTCPHVTHGTSYANHFQDPNKFKTDMQTVRPNSRGQSQNSLFRSYYRPVVEEQFMVLNEKNNQIDAGMNKFASQPIQTIDVNRIIPEDEPDNEEQIDEQQENEIQEDGVVKALESPEVDEYPINEEEQSPDAVTNFSQAKMSVSQRSRVSKASINPRRFIKTLSSGFGKIDDNMFETRSCVSKTDVVSTGSRGSRSSRTQEQNLNKLTQKAMHLTAKNRDTNSITSVADEERKIANADSKSIFSTPSRRSFGSVSINTSRMKNTITNAISKGFPELEQEVTPQERATNCQMKVQLDALKRVIDSYEQKAVECKRIAQTQRWQNKQTDLLHKLEKQTKLNCEQNTQNAVLYQHEDRKNRETYQVDKDRSIPHISGNEGYPRINKPSDTQAQIVARIAAAEHGQILQDQMQEKRQTKIQEEKEQRMKEIEQLAQWHDAPNKGNVNSNPGNVGFPARIQDALKVRNDHQDKTNLWVKTKRIFDLKQRLQNDLNIVVHEDTLNSTLKDTEDQLNRFVKREQKRNPHIFETMSNPPAGRSAIQFATMQQPLLTPKQNTVFSVKNHSLAHETPTGELLKKANSKPNSIFNQGSMTTASSRTRKNTMKESPQLGQTMTAFNTIQPLNSGNTKAFDAQSAATPDAKRTFDMQERLQQKIAARQNTRRTPSVQQPRATPSEANQDETRSQCSNIAKLMEMKRVGNIEAPIMPKNTLNESQRQYPWETRMDSCQQLERLIETEHKKAHQLRP